MLVIPLESHLFELGARNTVIPKCVRELEDSATSFSEYKHTESNREGRAVWQSAQYILYLKVNIPSSFLTPLVAKVEGPTKHIVSKELLLIFLMSKLTGGLIGICKTNDSTLVSSLLDGF